MVYAIVALKHSTNNHMQTPEASQPSRRISYRQTIHTLCSFCVLLPPHQTHPLSPPPYTSIPSLTIQSEAGGDFLGVVAEPIVARLLLLWIPLPHLYTQPHTRRPVFTPSSLLINNSSFRQDTCIRVHPRPHTHTTGRGKNADAGGCFAGERGALSSGWTRRRRQVGLLRAASSSSHH